MSAEHSQERVVYINGRIMPESEGALSFRDLGFIYGDAVFDTARTFGGKIFRLEQHVDRLFQSLRYARIDPGLTKAEIIEATEKVVEANAPLLGENEDYWVTQRISAGVKVVDGEDPTQGGATVVIECMPLPLRSRASFFRDGVPAQVAARRRIAAEALSPNVKSNNYLNMMIAQREVGANNPSAWALLCNSDGDIAEGAGCNFFIVRDGVVITPPTDFVLNGVSRGIALDLCRKLGIPHQERSVPLQYAMTSDEAFFTSTSLCICPTASINGVDYPAGAPGPVTRRLMDAFRDLVGFDYEAQYLAHLGNGPADVGI